MATVKKVKTTKIKQKEEPVVTTVPLKEEPKITTAPLKKEVKTPDPIDPPVEIKKHSAKIKPHKGLNLIGFKVTAEKLEITEVLDEEALEIWKELKSNFLLTKMNNRDVYEKGDKVTSVDYKNIELIVESIKEGITPIYGF